MVIDNFQDCFCGQQAQVTVFFVRVDNLEHPQDRAGYNDIFLIRSVMLDVEVDHVEELVENPAVFRVKQGLENVHEEFLVELVKYEFALVQLVIEHVY